MEIILKNILFDQYNWCARKRIYYVVRFQIEKKSTLVLDWSGRSLGRASGTPTPV